MSSLPYIAPQPLSDAGAILSGAKLYFYTTGASTTPKDTYSDKGLSSANANPVVADASGRFGPVFLKKDGGYRVVLKTSADVTIWTKDEVFAQAFAYDEETRRKAICLSPIDHGAAGDGSTNDATALQAAITAAGVGAIDLEGKTYRCDSALTLPSGITVRNGTLDFSACNADEFILAQGSSGSSVALSANVAEEATSFTAASIAGLAADDLLHVYDNSGQYAGELIKIASASGSTVNLTDCIQGAYTTANTASYKEITPKTGITIEDVTIIGNASASGNGNGLVFDRCYGTTLRNVQTRNHKGSGVMLKLCAETVIEGCSFRNDGVDVRDASIDTKIIGCRFYSSDLAIGVTNTNSGICYRSIVSGSSFSGAVVLNRVGIYSRYTTFTGCMLSGDGSGDGITVYGRDVDILGCQIRGFAYCVNAVAQTSTSLPVAKYDKPRRLTVRNCALFPLIGAGAGNTYAVTITVDDTFDWEQIDISNNTFHGDGVELDMIEDAAGDSYIRNLTIRGNMQDVGSLSTADFLTIRSSGATVGVLYMDRAIISGNTKQGGDNFIVTSLSSLIEVSSLEISGNVADGRIDLSSANFDIIRGVVCDNILEPSAGTYGINILGASDLVVRGNVVACSSSTTHGIFIDGAAGAAGARERVVVSGNTITGVAGTNANGIFIRDYASVVVEGNAIGEVGGATDFGISINSTGVDTDCITISGNTIQGIADTAGNCGIRVIGDSGQRASNVTISGNSYYGVRHGIIVDSYADKLAITGNTIELVATAAAGIYINGAAANAVDCITVTGNVVHAQANAAPCVHVNGYANNCTVSGNSLSNGTVGISLSAGAAAGIDRAVVANNVIDASVLGINVASVEDLTIAGNVHVDGTDGFLIDECTTFHINGNRITGASGYGIQCDNSTQEFTQGVVSGNLVRAAGIGVEVDASDATGSTHLTINGNAFFSTGNNAIEITGIVTGVTITGNACEASDLVPNIQITGDGAGNISQVTVVGNHLNNGTYGIEATNNDAASTYHSANTFSSMATANDNGAANFAVPVVSS